MTRALLGVAASLSMVLGSAVAVAATTAPAVPGPPDARPSTATPAARTGWRLLPSAADPATRALAALAADPAFGAALGLAPGDVSGPLDARIERDRLRLRLPVAPGELVLGHPGSQSPGRPFRCLPGQPAAVCASVERALAAAFDTDPWQPLPVHRPVPVPPTMPPNDSTRPPPPPDTVGTWRSPALAVALAGLVFAGLAIAAAAGVLRPAPTPTPRPADGGPEPLPVPTLASGRPLAAARVWPALPPQVWWLAASIVAVHLGAAAVPIVGWHHPDEMQQYLEQPFRVLHGYGFRVWEFEQGTRNWLLPGLLLGLQAGCEGLGIRDPLDILRVIRLCQHGLFLLGLGSLVRAAHGLWGRRTAWLVAGIVGLAPALVGLLNHPLSEAWAMSVVMLATWPLARHLRDGGDRPLLATGALLGVATLLRLQVGLLLPVVLVTLGAPGPRRTLSWRGAGHLLGGALAVLVAGWLLDGLTYGRFAQSTIENLSVHADLRTHETMGIQPWTFYVTESFDMLGLLPVLLAVGCALMVRRQPRDPFAWCAIVFCLGHAWIPHKEGRFLLPVLPLALATGCAAFTARLERLSAASTRRWTRILGLVLLVSAVMSWRYFWRGDEAAGKTLAARFLAEQTVDDWCVVGYEPHDLGGYFLLRRDVPFRRYDTLQAAARDRAAHPARCRFVEAPASLVDAGSSGGAALPYAITARFRNTAVLRADP